MDYIKQVRHMNVNQDVVLGVLLGFIIAIALVILHGGCI